MIRFLLLVAFVFFITEASIVTIDKPQKHPQARRVYAIENEATRLLRRGFAATGSCGVDRWDEKTLAKIDPSSATILAEAATLTSVPALDAERLPGWTSPTGPAPSGLRVPMEVNRDSLSGAYLIAYKLEADSDIHLELQSALDSSKTMIAEIPDPGCVSNLAARTLIATAREHFVVGIGQPAGYYKYAHVRVTLSGPVFFDFVHGQKGVALNGVELHPVLTFRRWRALTKS